MGAGVAEHPQHAVAETPAATTRPVRAPERYSLSPAAGTRRRWEAVDGAPLPMGATWIEEERAWNFALYSKHAERVVLLLYEPRDTEHASLSFELEPLRNKTGRVWHCRLGADQVGAAAYYAYRVVGPPPDGRFEWHAFDAEKVLLDPYARAVLFPERFDRDAAASPGTNAGRAPLGVLLPAEAPYDWGAPPLPRHDSDTIIYELHVRGFTRNPNSGVPEPSRGTFAGVIAKIPYLRELGITAVELMPVFQYDPQGEDYWGYTPLDFFAPHADYHAAARDVDVRRGFRDMVKALHDAGIEVLLDVVYNHTCERGRDGPIYSYKGIDNSTYYLMTGDPAMPYADYTGAENTLNCANNAVRRMIVDSMHLWAEEMHVDGFRFDLASVFARRTDGSLDLSMAPTVTDIGTHEELRHLRLIAEPWDGLGTSALGRAFPGSTWHQWNARFRDDVRRFLRGDTGTVPALMRRIYGSDDLFPDDRMNAYRPWQSVNYVTCHDGFTLYDLVSYQRKRNWANGHDNHDGPAESYSWNCGWEGDEHVPEAVLAMRRRQARNFIALLFLANGTPMLRAGDEFLQTQQGNDNPYNQDNRTYWLDWDRLNANRDFFRFVRLAIAFRKAHPSLGRSRFWRDDVRWYGVGAAPDTTEESHTIAFCLHGASQEDRDLYVMINAWQDALPFVVQEGTARDWGRVIDTGRPSPDDFRDRGDEAPLESMRYQVEARSVVVLMRK